MSRGIVGFGMSLFESSGRVSVDSSKSFAARNAEPLLPAFCSGRIALGDSIIAINEELVETTKDGIVQHVTEKLLNGTPGKAFEITFEASDGTRRNVTLLHVAQGIFPADQRVEEGIMRLRVSTGVVLESCDELKEISWKVERILPGSTAYLSQRVSETESQVHICCLQVHNLEWDRSSKGIVSWQSMTRADVRREDHLTRDEGERVILKLIRSRNGVERERAELPSSLRGTTSNVLGEQLHKERARLGFLASKTHSNKEADKEEESSPFSSCTDDSSPDLRDRFQIRRILFNADDDQPVLNMKIFQSDHALRSEIDRLNKLLESERDLYQGIIADMEKEKETLKLKLEVALNKRPSTERRKVPEAVMEDVETLLYNRVIRGGQIMLIKKGGDGSLAYCFK
eukprot:768459-Hanusia_phi.AAC.6